MNGTLWKKIAALEALLDAEEAPPSSEARKATLVIFEPGDTAAHAALHRAHTLGNRLEWSGRTEDARFWLPDNGRNP
jgi:hypothetical protein